MSGISRHRTDKVALGVGLDENVGKGVIKILIFLVETNSLHMINVVDARIYMIGHFRRSELRQADYGDADDDVRAAVNVGDSYLANAVALCGNGPVCRQSSDANRKVFEDDLVVLAALYGYIEFYRRLHVTIEGVFVVFKLAGKTDRRYLDAALRAFLADYGGDDRLALAFRRKAGVGAVGSRLRKHDVFRGGTPDRLLAEAVYVDEKYVVHAHDELAPRKGKPRLLFLATA